jgi:hypothetical protein
VTQEPLLSATLDVSHDPGRDLLWCVAFQACWDELRAWLHTDTVDIVPESTLADALNRERAAADELPQGAVVAGAGTVGEGVLDRLSAAAAAAFGEEADLPMLATLRAQPHDPRDVIAYAALLRRLAFATAFQRVERFGFGAGQVRAFETGGPGAREQRAQVTVHRYTSRQDFVCELATDHDDESILIARLEPRATLRETVSQVLAATEQGPAQAMESQDRLEVPCVAVDVAVTFDELVHRSIHAPTGVFPIAGAAQNLRLELDETGAFVRSEASLLLRGMAIQRMPEPRELICDGPFLLMLRRRGARLPYVAAWIATPQLLVDAA